MLSKKLKMVWPNVKSKIKTKSIWPMVCKLNNCFCCKKAEMNITQSNRWKKSSKKPNMVLPNVTSKIQTKSIWPMVCALKLLVSHIAHLYLPLSWNQYNTDLVSSYVFALKELSYKKRAHKTLIKLTAGKKIFWWSLSVPHNRVWLYTFRFENFLFHVIKFFLCLNYFFYV